MEKALLPDALLGERLILKRLTLDLAEQMFSYVDRDRARLREYLPWVDSMHSVADEEGYIKMTHEKWEQGAAFSYGLFQKSDGLYMGNIDAHDIHWEHNRCAIGYWILGDFERRGYMSEAVALLEEALFNVGFNRIEIHCTSTNARSASVPRRNHYHLDATLRQNRIEHGQYIDTLVFAKLKSEFL